MPVWRGGADAGETCRLREGEARRALARDQFKRRADQRLAQIAMMIAARPVPLAGVVPASAHVNGAYMEWGGKSMRTESDPCLANAPTEARQENSILIKSPRDAQLEEPSIR